MPISYKNKAKKFFARSLSYNVATTFRRTTLFPGTIKFQNLRERKYISVHWNWLFFYYRRDVTSLWIQKCTMTFFFQNLEDKCAALNFLMLNSRLRNIQHSAFTQFLYFVYKMSYQWEDPADLPNNVEARSQEVVCRNCQRKIWHFSSIVWLIGTKV